MKKGIMKKDRIPNLIAKLGKEYFLIFSARILMLLVVIAILPLCLISSI